MRLVQFQIINTAGESFGPVFAGILEGDAVYMAQLNGKNFSGDRAMVTLLERIGGDPYKLVQLNAESLNVRFPFKPRDCRLKPPLYNPEKILCIGLNYADHAKESGVEPPPEPVLFSKFSSAIIGPGETIVLPEESSEPDFEVELVIVIGRAGRRIKEADAMKHVAGYTVGHDVSARDWQLKKPGKQWLMGKTFDTFAPIGPAIVTPDEISNPHNLGIRCILNGLTVQSSNTNQLIFKTEALIAYISQVVTLKPGDIIFTGTPGGVGFTRKPPLYLKKGDVVTCEVDEVGTLINPVG